MSDRVTAAEVLDMSQALNQFSSAQFTRMAARLRTLGLQMSAAESTTDTPDAAAESTTDTPAKDDGA